IEEDGRYRIEVRSDDGATDVVVDGRVAESLPSDSIFLSVAASSAFFAAGSTGYSTGARPDRFDGLTLHTDRWSVRPFAVSEVRSSFFDDTARFPAGSVSFDHALVMAGIESRWTALPPLAPRSSEAAAA